MSLSLSSQEQQQQQQEEEEEVWLRIIQINDVYELDQFASFQTCIAEHSNDGNDGNSNSSRRRPDRVLVILAGDFLGPSLLSSLDQGASMIDCLNAVGVDFVCFGNHECDVPTQTALPKRIQQSNFCWLNSNMQELNDKVLLLSSSSGIHTPEYATVQVVSNKSSSKQIALLGLLTPDPSLYRPGSFANATIEPVIPTTEALLEKLQQQQQQDNDNNNNNNNDAMIDLIIPITHQSMAEDRALAHHFGGTIFPIILGGHDHTPMDETIMTTTTKNKNSNNNNNNGGARIFKTGYDAIYTGIIDIRWKNDHGTSTTITTTTTNEEECNHNGRSSSDNSDSDTDDDNAVIRTTPPPCTNNNNNTKKQPSPPPIITAKLVRTADYPPDPVMAERVAMHQQLLVELEQANLFRVRNWMNQRMKDCLGGDRDCCGSSSSSSTGNGDFGSSSSSSFSSHDVDLTIFSTKDNRLHPSTGTTALTTMIRMGMRCHCALINAGSVRGNHVYASDDDDALFFTWKDLKAEIPFPTLMTASYIPGHVLQDMITHSRSQSWLVPPIAAGGYIHTCTNICYNNRTHQIESIGGEPFEPDRDYLTALPLQFFQGIDHHTALLDWVATTTTTAVANNNQTETDKSSNSISNHSYLSHEEAARPAKQVIVEVFCALFWLQLGSFAEMDVSSRGYLTRDDVKKHCQQLYGHAFDVMVENLMSVADVLDEKDIISPLEVMVVQYIASDLIEHASTEDQQVLLMKKTAAHVLGTKDLECEEVMRMVEMLRNILDKDKDGIIHRSESMQALGGLRRQSLLR